MTAFGAPTCLRDEMKATSIGNLVMVRFVACGMRAIKKHGHLQARISHRFTIARISRDSVNKNYFCSKLLHLYSPTTVCTLRLTSYAILASTQPPRNSIKIWKAVRPFHHGRPQGETELYGRDEYLYNESWPSVELEWGWKD